MLDISIYGDYETAWCPGCGNHDILAALKKALALSEIVPEKLLMVSGIGQAAKAPHYLRANVFNGLHGRAIPAATGARLANPELTVVVESGDGCVYGEGGNHLLAAIRRNINITVLVHDNSIYGLTKGQASPTSTDHISSKTQPFGTFNSPLKPLVLAVAMGAGFVARGFSGDREGLAALIHDAIKYPGFALVDILSPCVSFNKYNTFGWYKNHSTSLPDGYDHTDRNAALAQAERWEDHGIPLGVLYRQPPRPTMEEHYPALKKGPLAMQPVALETLADIQNSYF